MDLMALQTHRTFQRYHCAVDTRARKTPFLKFLQLFPVLSFSILYNRSQDLNLASVSGFDLRNDLIDGLRLDGNITARTERNSEPGVKQPHVVLYFCDCCNSRTRIARDCLLLDGNRRRKSFDRVDIRLLHLLEKLTGIGGKGFHITTLSFAEN